ncbi:hypothetical protein SLS53_002270 [Cytospora paraplurivora]|uniref:Prolyl 4-hydroxylase alpha subunit domain-containing protein n=1 Tax=Cytospora paraplurivora TaxID=2898453 RepID=A0AAN9UG21_9PEZI
MSIFTSAILSGDPRSHNAKDRGIPERTTVQMTYASRDVSLPPDFLSLDHPPPDAQPVILNLIDWASTALPVNEGRFAAVLDNVISPSECAELLKLAESSVDVTNMKYARADQDPWLPAMINAGGGWEVLDSKYRNSDRIIWDNQEVVDRIWERCLQGRVGEVLRERMDALDDEQSGAWRRLGSGRKLVKQRWEFSRINQRMRFLRYEPGQFFKPHSDSSYGEEVDGKKLMTFFTIHLYLNDSVAEVGEEADLVGGATSFLSGNNKTKVDVDPKAGRLLIFQQRGLKHAGDDVVKGTKYTMRTDVLYELIREAHEE